ncbi:MAG: hypothetical protein LBD25_06300 [Coriobacteriales bacterium]|jgi:hypothetical protein|nr:hypothetical protein [Coriobacteriales bacterium]
MSARNHTTPAGRPDGIEHLRIGLTLAVFVLVVGGFALLGLLMPRQALIASERRAPAELPEISQDAVLSARFMHGFEGYAADGFPLREALRTARAAFVLDVFMLGDKDGLYEHDGSMGRFEPLDAAAVLRAADGIERMNAMLTENVAELRLFCAVVPDKSIYEPRGYPGFDPELAKRLLAARLPGLTHIDLSASLGAGDYYRTDLHWNQAALADGSIGAPGALEALSAALGCDERLDRSFTEHYAGEFAGVYPGQLALPVAPEALVYCTNPVIDAATASYLDPQAATFVEGPLYSLSGAAGRDPYDLFLCGAQPVVRLDNPLATTDRELLVFRDSFASSLAPLLLSGYKRVTLVDLRYIDYRLVPEHIELKPGTDVLFLYSSQTLNDPSVLHAG